MKKQRGAQRFSVLAVLATMVACHSVQAEPLSLDTAVEIATANAPQMAAQRAALEGAQSLTISAGRLPDPELILGVDNLPIEGADAYSVGADFMTMRKVGVMQSFPNSRKRAWQRERAAATVALARTQSLTTRLEVARSAADAWITVHVAEAVLKKLQLLEPEVHMQAEAARSALASGRGSSVDAIAAKAATNEWADRILIAKRELIEARAELVRWIGDKAQQPIAPPPSFKKLPQPREQLLASLQHHAVLSQFDAQLAVARSEIEVARAEKRPDWSVQLAYAKRSAPFDDMASVEFRMDLPLFRGTRQDPVIRARRAELSQIQAERDVQLSRHRAEVLNELAAWDSARERIELYELERLPLARLQSQTALAGFQAGTITLAQVLASQVSEIEVQLAYAQLTQELGRAWTFLRYLDAEHSSP